ncbi:hypothetical protein FI667_g9147, partial [Globisporangium splendens]
MKPSHRLPRKYGDRSTKLPVMSNSERGKYYRKKSREHEDGLEASTMQSSKQVQDLELLLCVQKQLTNQQPRRNHAESVMGQVLQYFAEAQQRDGLSTSFAAEVKASAVYDQCSRTHLSSIQSPARKTESSADAFITTQWSKHLIHHELLFFDLECCQVAAASDAGDSPVICLQGTLHGTSTLKTIVNAFPHVIQDQALIDRLVNQKVCYLCNFKFCFDSDGELAYHTLEADVVPGLLRILDNLADVNFVLCACNATTAISSSQPPLQFRLPSPCIPRYRADHSRMGSHMDLAFILASAIALKSDCS